MDRKKVESARDYLRELVSKGKLDALMLGHVSLVSRLLTTALDDQSDTGDECECDGCRASRTEIGIDDGDYSPGFWRAVDAAADRLFVRVDDNGNTSISTVDDYEIRLKAWESVQGFWFPDESEFDEAFTAAKKLYNFLSGQNEDVK